MFKRVEDDVLLGVSKVVTKKSQEKESLLIAGDKFEKNEIKKENVKDDYSLEDLIKITNENEKLIRSIIEKKNEIKFVKDGFLTEEAKYKDDAEDLEEGIYNSKMANNKEISLEEELTDEKKSSNKKTPSNETADRDEYLNMKDEFLSSLKEHITYLKEQIETKDKQLQNKDELIRNFQVLMKDDKDRIHQLESRRDEDKKVDEVIESQKEVECKSEIHMDTEKIDGSEDITLRENSENISKKRSFLNWFKK